MTPKVLRQVSGRMGQNPGLLSCPEVVTPAERAWKALAGGGALGAMRIPDPPKTQSCHSPKTAPTCVATLSQAPPTCVPSHPGAQAGAREEGPAAAGLG